MDSDDAMKDADNVWRAQDTDDFIARKKAAEDVRSEGLVAVAASGGKDATLKQAFREATRLANMLSLPSEVLEHSRALFDVLYAKNEERERRIDTVAALLTDEDGSVDFAKKLSRDMVLHEAEMTFLSSLKRAYNPSHDQTRETWASEAAEKAMQAFLLKAFTAHAKANREYETAEQVQTKAYAVAFDALLSALPPAFTGLVNREVEQTAREAGHETRYLPDTKVTGSEISAQGKVEGPANAAGIGIRRS